MHRYNVWFGTDGDYVQLLKLDNGQWRVCTSWLIPGSQHEGY